MQGEMLAMISSRDTINYIFKTQDNSFHRNTSVNAVPTDVDFWKVVRFRECLVSKFGPMPAGPMPAGTCRHVISHMTGEPST